MIPAKPNENEDHHDFLHDEENEDVRDYTVQGISAEAANKLQMVGNKDEENMDDFDKTSNIVVKANQGTQSAPKDPVTHEVDVNVNARQSSVSDKRLGYSREKSSQQGSLCLSRPKGRKRKPPPSSPQVLRNKFKLEEKTVSSY